ncbi:hypothetical protein SAMN05444959_10552 [Paracoccus seriniphilus]|uniref:Uncharacterized protein n=1 Tax=Paracoccus seriniphilus TaxID=184748 RepID=A0A239PTM8_9RHOB|nr:hypothetical protein SAMN05444959_10552 [Paracoccus seriniphilus]
MVAADLMVHEVIMHGSIPDTMKQPSQYMQDPTISCDAPGPVGTRKGVGRSIDRGFGDRIGALEEIEIAALMGL